MDAFAEPRAPVAVALAWCGWKVVAIDRLLDPSHDLADPVFQQFVEGELRNADASFWAPDCSTLTRARERPVKGHRNAPKPLRGEHAVRGLPDLPAADWTRVQVANAFTDIMWRAAEGALGSGKGFTVENPARSYIWQFQQCRNLRRTSEWQRVEYDACIL